MGCSARRCWCYRRCSALPVCSWVRPRPVKTPSLSRPQPRARPHAMPKARHALWARPPRRGVAWWCDTIMPLPLTAAPGPPPPPRRTGWGHGASYCVRPLEGRLRGDEGHTRRHCGAGGVCDGHPCGHLHAAVGTAGYWGHVVPRACTLHAGRPLAAGGAGRLLHLPRLNTTCLLLAPPAAAMLSAVLRCRLQLTWCLCAAFATTRPRRACCAS